jgi:predicted transposase/invertase (TIGR01784 family)
MDSIIAKAQERFDFVIQDKEFLRAYNMREMALSDLTTSINTALEKGIAKGSAKKQIEIAQKLKDRGRPLEEIVEDTGLDIETIESLQ